MSFHTTTLELETDSEIKTHTYENKSFFQLPFPNMPLTREREEKDLKLEYSKSFPVEEKTTRATSASQRTESSSAFLKSPLRRLENVTCLAVALSIFLI